MINIEEQLEAYKKLKEELVILKKDLALINKQRESLSEDYLSHISRESVSRGLNDALYHLKVQINDVKALIMQKKQLLPSYMTDINDFDL